jgi:hypothetical protein
MVKGINAEAIEWLETLGDMEHQRLFRPLGGSCADSEEGGVTTFARLYKDHNPYHPIDSPCGHCIGASELIVVE